MSLSGWNDEFTNFPPRTCEPVLTINTRKVSTSQEMSKQKVVEDLKNGKKGKITSFFSKEQPVCGKFKMSLHLSLHTVRSADRVIDEFVGLSKIV